jgi:hypothetical protein
MKDEETKNTTALTPARQRSVVDLDGFNSFTSEVEGSDDVNTSSRVIQGTKLKYIDPRWLIDERDVTGMRLTLIGVRNVVNKWGPDNKPLIPPEILPPGQKFPDFKKLNNGCPRSEWRVSFGKEVGPWSGQHCLYFVDSNYATYTWASPITTIGSSICVGEIVDHVNRVRKFRDPNVYVEVELSHCFFPTGYGDRERPHLLVKGLVKLASNRMAPLPTSDAPGLADERQGAPADAQSVEPVTLAEELSDTVKY